MKLKAPLFRRQIEAAGRIRQQLRKWQLSDAALIALHEKLPGFEPEVCLLKSVAVNAIYGTNVLAIIRMAKHVEEVLGRHDLSQVGAELVIEMANAPEGKGQQSRKRTSFASKFCHFFVAAERFPIYDGAACEALKLHFGERVQAHDYKTFCSCITQLRDSVGNGCDTRVLDHYLWLTGMYMRWKKERKKENPKVNAELLKLYNKLTKTQSADVATMIPVTLH